jgi:hypothetical protein
MTDDGDRVEIQELCGRYLSIRHYQDGSQSCVVIGLDRARDNLEYAREHGRVYGELVA